MLAQDPLAQHLSARDARGVGPATAAFSLLCRRHTLRPPFTPFAQLTSVESTLRAAKQHR